MNMKSKSDVLVILSIIAVVLAAVDFLGNMAVVGLAGTQWILIGIVLAIYALYFKARGM
ncbi:MAG: hypothetical protein WC238_01165 [Parcubacteria group bacterium]|jgi:succinate-acetate transporter protein